MLYWLFNLWWNYPLALLVFSMTLKPPEDTPIPTTYSTTLPILHCGNPVVFEALLWIGSLKWSRRKINLPLICFFVLPLPGECPAAIFRLFWSFWWCRWSVALTHNWWSLGSSSLWSTEETGQSEVYMTRKEGERLKLFSSDYSMDGASGDTNSMWTVTVPHRLSFAALGLTSPDLSTTEDVKSFQ